MKAALITLLGLVAAASYGPRGARLNPCGSDMSLIWDTYIIPLEDQLKVEKKALARDARHVITLKRTWTLRPPVKR